MLVASRDARDNAETATDKRPQYWSELNESEKLERMREVVKHQDNRLAGLKRQVARLARKFMEHGHKQDGSAVLPADFTPDDSFGADKRAIHNDTEVYF